MRADGINANELVKRLYGSLKAFFMARSHIYGLELSEGIGPREYFVYLQL